MYPSVETVLAHDKSDTFIYLTFNAPIGPFTGKADVIAHKDNRTFRSKLNLMETHLSSSICLKQSSPRATCQRSYYNGTVIGAALKILLMTAKVANK